MKSFNYKNQTFNHGDLVEFTYESSKDKHRVTKGKIYINDRYRGVQQMFIFSNVLSGACPDEKHDRGEFKNSWWVSTEAHGTEVQVYDPAVVSITLLSLDGYEII
jgi:hypothetical protein